MKKVELHQAFIWTCPACARDNFARAITIDEAQLTAEERAEAEALVETAEMYGNACVMAPTVVTCGHCGATFEGVEPGDLDTDGDGEDEPTQPPGISRECSG